MDASWLPHTVVKAQIDRIRFTLEPVKPTTRAEVAANLPLPPRAEIASRARIESRRKAARWELREKGEAGTEFEVTVHDVICLPAITAVIDRLNARIPLARDPRLLILEVAMDVWPKVPGTLDLVRIAADLHKGAKFEPSDNSRAAGAGRGNVKGLFGYDGPYLRMKEGRSIYVGEPGDEFMIRVYPKVTDNGAPLPLDQQRARFEVEMTRYPFELLSPQFHLWTVREGLPGWITASARATPKLRRYPRRTRKAHTFMTRSFIGFNKRVYRALERLTASVQSGRYNPFHDAHLLAAGLARVTPHSVTTDYFFHPVHGVTAGLVSENGAAALTTQIYRVENDPDWLPNAA